MRNSRIKCWDARYRNLNWKRQPVDPRDRTIRMFRPFFKGVVTLPESVDLRPKCSGVEDQGEIGSCTAQALAGALEYLDIKTHGTQKREVSRLFAYYNARRMMGPWYIGQDSGSFIRTEVKAALRYGVCDETIWPYDVSKFAVRPGVACYADAQAFQVTQYASVTGATPSETLQNIKVSLAQGYPVMLGFDVYESFMTPSVAASGIMPMPDTTKEVRQGGHAVMAVGYGDDMRTLIMRNSWGAEWGQAGYFMMPYGVILAGNMASDFTVVTGEETGSDATGVSARAIGTWNYLFGHKERGIA